MDEPYEPALDGPACDEGDEPSVGTQQQSEPGPVVMVVEVGVKEEGGEKESA